MALNKVILTKLLTKIPQYHPQKEDQNSFTKGVSQNKEFFNLIVFFSSTITP